MGALLELRGISKRFGASRALSGVVHAFAEGERNVGALRAPALSILAAAGFRLDYATLADADELTPLADTATVDDRALFAIAGFLGKTRLIDNVVLGEDPAPIASS